jgi:voltage-gated potassium channel
MRPIRRPVRAYLRYLWVLLARFKVSVAFAVLLFGAAPLAYVALYRGASGERIGFGQALHHVYFLLYGEPSLPYVSVAAIEVMNVLIPPLGIAVLIDGMVRFAYLYFAKHRSDKEWIQVIARTMKDHVVVCGAGRIGYRVAEVLLGLGREVVIIEKKEDASFVSVLRDQKVPLLIDDIRSAEALKRLNVENASAIVCATNDDIANLNAALDARKLNPRIRVVMRLFDEDLVIKVREAFNAQALSTSAIAAPGLALAALDPRILHSFRVGGHLLVVSRFKADHGLPELTVTEVRDRFGGLTLALERPGQPEVLHPQGEVRIQRGDELTVQLSLEDYRRLRDFTGESQPPMASNAV